MARLVGTLAAIGVATTTSQKTILQLRTSSHLRVALLAFGIGFHGTSNTNEPITCKFLRQGSNGTMTSVTAAPCDEDLTETFETTGGKDASAEPSGTTIIPHPIVPIHPQTSFSYIFPAGKEIIIKPSSWLGLVVVAPAGVNCDAWFQFEE